MDSSRENWSQAESSCMFKDLEIESASPLPKELGLDRNFPGHLIVATTGHKDFAKYLPYTFQA